MTQQELLFFDALPGMLPVYAQLRERILAACPGTQVRVSKTQISFRGRYLFAMVSLPRRRMKAPQEEHIIVSFGLGYEVQSERIFALRSLPRAAGRTMWPYTTPPMRTTS